MRISDWSSDVCSSDLSEADQRAEHEADADQRSVDPEIIGDSGTDAEDFAVILVEVKSVCRRAARGPCHDRAHARTPRPGVAGMIAVANTTIERASEIGKRRVGKEWVRTCRSRG